MSTRGVSAGLDAVAAEISPAGASAVEALAAKIRTLIAKEGLGVGDSLPSERELCERFATSRNTVREAMRMLKAYGIVEVRPKVGATIIDNRMTRAFDLFSYNPADVTRDTFTDIQSFRGLLEVASVDRVLDRVTPDDIAALRALNEELAEVQSIASAAELDFSFHVRLVSIMGNRAMVDVYNIMKPVILKIMVMGKTKRTFATETHDEHAAIVDALEARDRIHYQYAMQSHLERGLALYQVAANEEH